MKILKRCDLWLESSLTLTIFLIYNQLEIYKEYNMQDHKEKQMTRNEAIQKIEAYKTLNSVLVQQSSNFMNGLTCMLTEKQVQQDQIKEKLEKGEGSNDDNAEYLYLGGYVQCLKDILGAKARQN